MEKEHGRDPNEVRASLLQKFAGLKGGTETLLSQLDSMRIKGILPAELTTQELISLQPLMHEVSQKVFRKLKSSEGGSLKEAFDKSLRSVFGIARDWAPDGLVTALVGNGPTYYFNTIYWEKALRTLVVTTRGDSRAFEWLDALGIDRKKAWGAVWEGACTIPGFKESPLPEFLVFYGLGAQTVDCIEIHGREMLKVNFLLPVDKNGKGMVPNYIAFGQDGRSIWSYF